MTDRALLAVERFMAALSRWSWLIVVAAVLAAGARVHAIVEGYLPPPARPATDSAPVGAGAADRAGAGMAPYWMAP